nr:glycosyltransferase family 61 protein [Vibrio anguillarum]
MRDSYIFIMNKLKIVSILKVFYYMLPKFIRVQYSDSVTVLRNMALGDKILHNDFFVENKIKLVKELESLGATFDIITHIIGRKNIIG